MPKENTKGRAVRVTRKEGGFPVRFPHSAGIDIGSGAHFVAAPPHADGRANVRSFGTTTGALAEMADWIRRMQKCLDQMNIRVHRAMTDISGHTGMAIIRAIVSGERDPVISAGFPNRSLSAPSFRPILGLSPTGS